MEAKWSKIIVHASAFFAPFIIPIIFFLISTDDDVKRLSIQALLFQIAIGLLMFVSGIFSVLIIGIPFLILFWAIGWIAPIIGIVRAYNNEYWNYPIVGRFV